MNIKLSFFIIIFAMALTVFSLVSAALVMNSSFQLSSQMQNWIYFALPILMALLIYIQVAKNRKNPEKAHLYEI